MRCQGCCSPIYIYIFFCNPVQATVHVTEAGDANGSAGVLWPSPSQGREWRGRPTAFSNLCRSLLTPVVRHYQSVHALGVCICIYSSLSLLFFLSPEGTNVSRNWKARSETSRVFRLSAKYLNWAPSRLWFAGVIRNLLIRPRSLSSLSLVSDRLN